MRRLYWGWAASGDVEKRQKDQATEEGSERTQGCIAEAEIDIQAGIQVSTEAKSAGAGPSTRAFTHRHRHAAPDLPCAHRRSALSAATRERFITSIACQNRRAFRSD